MAKIFLPGQPVPQAEDDVFWPPQLDGVMSGKIIGAGQVSHARGAEDQPQVFAVDNARATDIVEIELEDGLKIWQSVESAEADFQDGVSRSGADQALLLPRTLSFGGTDAQSRGLGGHLVRAIRIMRGDPVGKLGKNAALTLARKIEDTLDPGFYRCARQIKDGTGTIGLTPVEPGDISTTERILVLVHGTFSSTNGSFGELAIAPTRDVWNALETAYPGGIYALEHRSVTESPVKNATDLINALPKGAQISLMSHSRGGMVAELVSRAARLDVGKHGAIDDVDLDIFSKVKTRAAQLTELKALQKALADKALKVDRVVRVAGPLAGTTLASERLDRYLSVALNVFELLPILRRTGVADLLKSFLMACVRAKADPNTLPGLEAMMPGSPLTRMLNRVDVVYDNRLRVIGGDTEGGGILHRLGVLAADLFYRADHDFVVDTASMTRGGPRSHPTKPFLVEGPEVSHFSYFYNPTSQREIVGAAIEEHTSLLTLSPARGVPDIDATEPDDFPELVSRGGANDPVCFVLPGILGSHLRQNNAWIWTNPLQIMFGGLDRIRIDRDHVRSTKPIGSYYWDLCRFLTRTHKVVPFDYDWRLSILEQGHDSPSEKLGALVEAELDNSDRPIRFLAHSMGGLVVRAMFHARPDLWNRVKLRNGSRFVMLGTPNCGAFSMMHTLLGRAGSVRKLELADTKHNLKELMGIVASFHGGLQLLPHDDGGRFVSDQFWDELHALHGDHWVKPSREALQVARDGQRVLAAHQLDPDLTCYVAGVGAENTISSVRLDPTAEGANRIRFYAVPQGDGTVTWKSGIPKGIPTWYVNAIHGDLPRARDAFPAYLDLLETGTTTQLSKQAPRLSRAAEKAETPVVDRPVELYPDQQDILDSFMGASKTGAPATQVERPRTKVSVLHGNLRFATYPVAVGHYANDPMMGAEAALDHCLDHDLSRVRDLGLYPGDLETCEVILRDDCSPQGAVVIGLGQYGSLTPGDLKDTFHKAILRFGLASQERRKAIEAAGGQMAPFGLSTLLIGHQGTNMTVQQSVEAILQAVAEANQILDKMPIEHLQFVELYDDTAYQAASALDNVRALGRMGTMFQFDGEIRRIQDARVRTRYGKQTDWWQRISVRQNAANEEQLDYVAVTETARSAFQVSVVQPRALQHLLTQRKDGTATSRDVGRLLFELLIPQGLKTFARDNQNILLELDEHTAAYPWELMEDDYRSYEFIGAKPGGATAQETDMEPLVARAPVIRKLIQPGPKIPRATTNTALVVGDPVSDLVALPGAQAEAAEVNALLGKAGWTTLHQDRPENGFNVIKEMMLKPAQVIHLAGHGVYASDRYKRTGMVLGQDLYLSVSEIEQMRYVPELVFLNCCHLGHIGTEVNEIAASLSVAFIKRGARAVVAAGWEVDDAAANLFARSFYGAMLAGDSFGRAVHMARRQVFQAKPETNTWGAYQCYGDPDYRFRERNSGSAGRPRAQQYYSVHHATRAARNIAESAASGRRSGDALLANLISIESSAKDKWKTDSEWCAAMGLAYARIDAFDLAIPHLERSLAQPDTAGSIHIIQKLQDLRVRQAARVWRLSSNGGDRKSAGGRLKDAVQAALDCYEKLDVLGGDRITPKRECLKGSALKRLAQVQTGAGRKTALKQMTRYYGSAMKTAFEIDPDRIDLYAAVNWLTGSIVGADPDVDSATISVWLDRLTAEGARQHQASPGFWTALVRPQTDVLRGLHDPEQATDERLNQIRSHMDQAWRRGGAFRQAQSLREQIAFVKHMAGDADRKQAEWLDKVEHHVTALTG
ncbi:CHAT domain-containing protein [Rhodobacteraceae bacterium F11138]|nr:CHAT domain-containing protein [Rhodobacteraceae bacterium F11138]